MESAKGISIFPFCVAACMQNASSCSSYRNACSNSLTPSLPVMMDFVLLDSFLSKAGQINVGRSMCRKRVLTVLFTDLVGVNEGVLVPGHHGNGELLVEQDLVVMPFQGHREVV